MSFEQQEIFRPYEGLDALESLLRNIELRVRSQSVWTSDSEIRLRPEDFNPLFLSVRWAWEHTELEESLEPALEEASLELEEVSLIGILRCPTTKQMRIFLNEPLSELVEHKGLRETKIAVDERPRLLPNRTVTAEFYLLLNQDLKNNFPFPYRKGTWLSTHTVTIKSESGDDFNFAWGDLDAQTRLEHGIHKDSSLFIVNTCPMHQADRFADCVAVYLDEDHRRYLASLGSSANGKLMQAILVKEVVSSALTFTLAQLQKGGTLTPWVEVESSPILGRLFKVLSANGSWAGNQLDPEEIYHEFGAAPSKVNESLEDLFQIRKLSASLARESE